MRALHLTLRSSTNSAPPLAFPVKPATPSDLLFSDTYSLPGFAAQLQNDTADAEGDGNSTSFADTLNDGVSTEENANSTAPSPAPQDSRSRYQYLLEVITTSPTRGELTWKETLLPERFTTSRAPIPCHDVVGRIVAVRFHPKLPLTSATSKPRRALTRESKYKIGDVVYGLIDFDQDGAAADQVLVWDNEICKVPVPPQAIAQGPKWDVMLATIPLAGLTAWQALFEKGSLQEPGFEPQNPLIPTMNVSEPDTERPILRILITGASGAVGLLAVQMAAAAKSRRRDIHITAICNSRHTHVLRELGADVIASYDLGVNIEDEVVPLAPFDLILDLAGPPLLPAILSMHSTRLNGHDPTNAGMVHQSEHAHTLLRPNGKIVSIATPWTNDLARAIKTDEPGKAWLKDRFKFFVVKPDTEQLSRISDLVEHGRLKCFVHEEVFNLERGKEAMEECERRGRQTLGKVVIRVSGSSLENDPSGANRLAALSSHIPPA